MRLDPGKKSWKWLVLLALGAVAATLIWNRGVTEDETRPEAPRTRSPSRPAAPRIDAAEPVAEGHASSTQEEPPNPEEAPARGADDTEDGGTVEIEAGATLAKEDVQAVVTSLRPHLERCIRNHGAPLRSSEETPLRFRMHIRGRPDATRVEGLALQGGRSPSPYLDACFIDVTEEIPLPRMQTPGEATVSSPLRSTAP